MYEGLYSLNIDVVFKILWISMENIVLYAKVVMVMGGEWQWVL